MYDLKGIVSSVLMHSEGVHSVHEKTVLRTKSLLLGQLTPITVVVIVL